MLYRMGLLRSLAGRPHGAGIFLLSRVMIEISVQADIKNAIRYLDDAQRRQLPFATSRAINAVANDAKLTMRGELAKSFDRPKPYTLGGLFVGRSDKRNLIATIGLIDQPRAGNRAPIKYLSAQIGGGTRRMQGFERALQKAGAMPYSYQVVPGEAAKLDAYGNLAKSQLAEIFGVIKAGIRNLRVHTGRGKRAYAKGYFVAMPGDTRTAHLQPGLYQRIERSGGSVIRPVLMYVHNSSYGKRLDLIRPAERTVRQKFAGHFDRELAAALDTAR